MTRRQALELLGVGAAAAALPSPARAQAPSFPKGAVIRTVLRDYAPEELAGGATLFHEHMQLGPDFNAKFAAAGAAVRAANGEPPRGGGPGAGDGQAARAGGTGRGTGAAPTPAATVSPVDRITEELITAKNAGIACIVDAGHSDMGRDINFVRQVSMKS